MTQSIARVSVIAAAFVVFAVGCAGQPALQRLAETRRLSAELLVQFSKAADATNRVVMVNGEGGSESFAQQSERAKTAVQQNTETLKALLVSLRFAEETELLNEFARRFDDYRVLDRRILGLAFENTNVKAQQLAFGDAHQAANAFRVALLGAAGSSPAPASWQTRALAASAIAAVREIQVLQAQHIPEDDAAIMTRFEEQMAAAETVARQALNSLASLAAPGTQAGPKDANVALDRFMSLNAQIVSLSRRNSNVQSLALSLGEKGTLAARCEDGLRALQDALAKRGFSGTR